MADDPDRFLLAAIELGFLSPDRAEELVVRRRECASPTEPVLAWLRSEGALSAADTERLESAVREADLCAPQSLVGRTLGAWRLVRLVARGGMGDLYLAEGPEPGARYAVKVPAPRAASDPRTLARFRLEADLAHRIRDPNLVPTLAHGDEDGIFWFVMPFVDGADLHRVVAEGGRIPYRRSLDLVTHAAQGLGALHRGGVVHRDVKPANLLLDLAGRVLVADLGLARLAEGAGRLTSTGRVLGTPAFLSPEQARGRVATDRSDVYCLGLTWYFLLAGRPPFEASSTLQLLNHQVHSPLPDPAFEQPEARGLAAGLLGWMTAKDPADRPASMADVVRELELLRVASG